MNNKTIRLKKKEKNIENIGQKKLDINHKKSEIKTQTAKPKLEKVTQQLITNKEIRISVDTQRQSLLDNFCVTSRKGKDEQPKAFAMNLRP